MKTTNEKQMQSTPKSTAGKRGNLILLVALLVAMLMVVAGIGRAGAGVEGEVPANAQGTSATALADHERGLLPARHATQSSRC